MYVVTDFGNMSRKGGSGGEAEEEIVGVRKERDEYEEEKKKCEDEYRDGDRGEGEK